MSEKKSLLDENKQRKTKLQKIIEKILNFHLRIKQKFKKKYKKEINEYDDEEEEINTNYIKKINTNLEKIYDPFPLLNNTDKEVIINIIENKLTEIIEDYESSEEKEEKKVEDLLIFFKETKKETKQINFFE